MTIASRHPGIRLDNNSVAIPPDRIWTSCLYLAGAISCWYEVGLRFEGVVWIVVYDEDIAVVECRGMDADKYLLSAGLGNWTEIDEGEVA